MRARHPVRTHHFAAVMALAAAATWAAAEASAQGRRALDASAPITYWVADGPSASGMTAEDRTLARWALEAWASLADPPIRLEPGAEETATVRVYWVGPSGGLYGEMRAREIEGRPAADVFVHPSTEGLGRDIHAVASADRLFRDTIVYLTCVHELGHAFGLGHTSAFADIMYSFQYGGDFVAYFGRFREKLQSRGDIRTASPFSAGDMRRFRALYAD